MLAVACVALVASACTSKKPSPPSFYYAEPMQVFFDSGNVVLSDEARSVIREAVRRARKFDCGKLLVVGHSDAVAYEPGGIDLSTRRAATVKNELTRDGYRNSIAIEGRGDSDPLAPNKPGQPEEMNRRVIIDFGCRIHQ